MLPANPKKLALFGIFLSLGLVLQAIENIYLPSMFIPGVKIGLANLITLLMLPFFGFFELGLAVLLRVVLSSFFSGTFLSMAFYFSLSGATISFLVMYVLYKTLHKRLSYAGISLAGALFHNIAQLMVAVLVVGSWAVLIQLPILILSAILTGLFLGIVGNILSQQLEDIISYEL
ncbi:MAG: Gx transporter family protein [Actinobacteria bacterium]|nr:MAG: Gx transporter family protein [Actinomycetota bacterium]